MLKIREEEEEELQDPSLRDACSSACVTQKQGDTSQAKDRKSVV